MPLPQFPTVPDDNPILAVRVIREYVRALTGSLSVYLILAITIVAPVVVFAGASLIFGFNWSLAWASDLVPFTFAVISVGVSVKALRDEHSNIVIVFVLFLGLAGTVIIHYSKVRAYKEHHAELDKLESKVDAVGNQNSKLLDAFIGKSLTPQEAETERRQNIQKALRSEYILSHDNISQGLLAGTEFPPAEWTNKRLKELGEKWVVGYSAMTENSPLPCVISPNAGAGGQGYEHICDKDMGQMAIDEANKIEDLTDDTKTNWMFEGMSLRTKKTDYFDPKFYNCCKPYLPEMRAEVLARLGQTVQDDEEISLWKYVLTSEGFLL
jgi:hypothetical protein